MAHKMTKPIPCTVCGKPSWSRKLCNNHYQQARNKGLLDSHRRITADDVLLDRIEKTATCWVWTGQKNAAGYGTISIGGIARMAHRKVYERLVGPIPEGLNLLHSCDNPICVNPAHLRPGTQKENIQDAVDRRRLCWGEKKKHHKLKSQDVVAIRADKRPNSHIAAQYGVSRKLISGIKNGKKRLHD